MSFVRHGRLRVLSYNILLGGRRREESIAAVIARTDADVVVMQEASHVALLERLARDLRMALLVAPPSDASDLNIAALTRLPVRSWRAHRHPGRMLRGHLECDLVVGGRAVEAVRIHGVHLAARFGERANGEVRRMREIRAVLARAADPRDAGELVVGDFNAIAPGDVVAATRFFARMAELRRARLLVREADGLLGPRRASGFDVSTDAAWIAAGIDPRLDVGIPRLPTVVGSLTARIPRSSALDRALSRMIDRRTIQHLADRGYVDCYRRAHPRAQGFTCATWMPAARIDYVFATSHLADLLLRCDIVGSRGWPDAHAAVASDHFPLIADFRV